tara:strand:+ start:4109 stop:4648 length:540 start_codon:yes stop_codon:yes gene_type:complete
MKHLMLDLETYGTGPGCVIRSIGAVVFDPRTPALGAEFYTNITEEDQIAAGAFKDTDTVRWWAQQGDEAKAVLEKDQIDLKTAVDNFNNFWKANKLKFVWAQGAAFDPVLWESACKLVDLKPPWEFYNTRDTRTVYDMAGLNTKTVPRQGIYHYALDDCKHQVRCVYKSYLMRDGVTKR